MDEELWLTAALVLLGSRTRPGASDSEQNTYGLPTGVSLARWLKAEWAKLLQVVLAEFPAHPLGTELPNIHPLEGRAGMLARGLAPLLAPYWAESGKATADRLGAWGRLRKGPAVTAGEDPWSVTSPWLKRMALAQAMDFCQSTLETTDLEIGQAKAKLRQEMAAGLVEFGDSVPELAARVKSIFAQMADWKAVQIAATEASRAVHSAQEIAARASGVVAGFELLISADACPLCRRVATEAKRVRVGTLFAKIGSHPEYSEIRHPPIHPHCMCSLIEVLKPEYGGPADPAWAETLIQPQVGIADWRPPPGKKVPKPEPEKKEGPPVPPLVPRPAGGARPIGERIKQYAEGDRKVKEILAAGGRINAGLDKVVAARAEVQLEARDLAARAGELGPAIKALGPGPRRDALVAELKGLAEQHKQARAALAEAHAVEARLRRDLAEAVAGVLEVPPGRRADIAVRLAPTSDPWGPGAAAHVEAARAWVVRVTDGSGAPPIRAWVQGRSGARAAWKDGTSTLVINSDRAQAEVVVHEFGHALDYRFVRPGGAPCARAREFLEYRVGSEPPTDLGALSAQMKGELGRKDEFDRAFTVVEAYYVGKLYQGQGNEVVAMGLEKLYKDPVGFAAKDPEYCKFILGMLDGTLR